VVVILIHYKKQINSSAHNSNKFERNFSLAVYDYLEDIREQGRYHELKRKYNSTLTTLEKIAQEAFLIDMNGLTKSFIEECLNGYHKELIEKLKIYLLAFN